MTKGLDCFIVQLSYETCTLFNISQLGTRMTEEDISDFPTLDELNEVIPTQQ